MTDDDSRLAHLADELEAAQLAIAGSVLANVPLILGLEQVSAVELRYLAGQLAMALSDVLRVARSRGERLPCGEPRAGNDQPT